MNHQSKQLIAIIFVFVAVLLTTSALAISLSLEEVQFNIDTQNLDWTASENSISDLSDAEYDNLRSLKLPDDYLEPEEVPNLDPLPFGDRDSWDWRDHNGVTAVKHQGGCGSCWAFASTGVVESFILIYDGLNWDLSEQQLVSCNNQGYGCDGGWIYFQPYQYTGGVFESCMPYEASDSVPCTQNQCDKVAYIDSWSEINSSVNSIKNALVDGPVACAMYAFDDLSYYTGGCYSHGYASSVNHGVIIVGYNDNDCSGDGAWIVKNSWGSSWGENGFFRIKYGDSQIGYGATRIYYTPQTNVDLNYSSHYVDDSLYGNNSGQADPGEQILLPVTIGNSGTTLATGVGATLSCNHFDVTVNDNFAAFPDISGGYQQQSYTPHFSVYIGDDIQGGTGLTFNLSITSNQGTFNDSFYIVVGNQSMPTATPPPPTNTPYPTWTGAPTTTPFPTYTGAPTNTPMPTFTQPPVPTTTQLPTFTPNPDHSPTPYPTSTPYPTFTPGSNFSPVPTETPIPKIFLDLLLNQKVYSFNDQFRLNLRVNNSGPAFFAEQYVFLQIENSFWFWPDWSREIDKKLMIFDSGATDNTILEFVWPPTDAFGRNYRFHAVLCQPGSFDMISNIDTVEFGFE